MNRPEVVLPAEVWLQICEQLEHQRDFGSLFSCTQVNQVAATAAVRSLYCIHSLSPVIQEGADIENLQVPRTPKEQFAFQVKSTSKWALQWRSIILSSIGQAKYPYCLYIKSLDLRNLSQLFDSGIFRDHVQDVFFNSQISAFLIKINKEHKKSFGRQSLRRQNLKFDANFTCEVTGEAITKFVHTNAQRTNSVAALEEVSGDIPQNVFFTWTGRLARLKTVTLWSGESLSKDIGIRIKDNCPNFTSLTLFQHLGVDADSKLAGFFNNLRPNSITYFEMIHSNDLHEETFKSLQYHSESLDELKLASLKSKAMTSLPLLAECKNLTSLLLQDSQGEVDLEVTDKAACATISNWLRSCRNLKSLTIDNIRFGAYMVVPVLRDPEIHLQKFEMLKFQHITVYEAISHQTKLQELKLRGEAPTVLAEIRSLVRNISSLDQLRFLDILGLSDTFTDDDIAQLIKHLKRLHDLSISGTSITDLILPPLHHLSHLHSLHLTALTQFTFPSLKTYISTLSPTTNANFVLSIMCQVLEYDLGREQQEELRRLIGEKVDGRFEFVLFREYGDEGSDDDSEGD